MYCLLCSFGNMDVLGKEKTLQCMKVFPAPSLFSLQSVLSCPYFLLLISKAHICSTKERVTRKLNNNKRCEIWPCQIHLLLAAAFSLAAPQVHNGELGGTSAKEDKGHRGKKFSLSCLMWAWVEKSTPAEKLGVVAVGIWEWSVCQAEFPLKQFSKQC